jgi:lipoprotein LprG
MAHHLPLSRPASGRGRTLLGAALASLVLLSGCGDSASADDQSPAEVMEEAKRHFDDSSSVRIALSTESTPTSGNGVLGATGTVTHDPAFEGEVKVVLSGLTATVPVTSVDDKVYAKLPMQTKYTVIEPGEYGAPDPADFADPDAGLSGLLTKIDDLEKGEETRDGDQVLTSYTGSVPGKAVKQVIPSADAAESYATRVGIDDEGFARTVRVTGIFFSGSDEVTYDVEFDGYGEDVVITPPSA